LRAERNGGQHTNGEITCSERDREAYQEHACGQRPHGLAGERVVEDEPEDAPLFRVGRRRAGIANRLAKIYVAQFVDLAIEHIECLCRNSALPRSAPLDCRHSSRILHKNATR
jgi:hypothetical protein